MTSDFCETIVDDFLRSSRECVEILVEGLRGFSGDQRKVRVFSVKNERRTDAVVKGSHFFLRASVEYSNPHLTVEEVQGIVAARLFEVCGNYCQDYGLTRISRIDRQELYERLRKPPDGKIVAFLLNTDDVEPDRYSMNPLKASLVHSGQSAFPAASVKNAGLQIDEAFMKKYEGSLISWDEAERIGRHLAGTTRYMDMVDRVKYEQLEALTEAIGLNLCLPSIRMPLTVLEREKSEGMVHYIIRESHADYEAVERVYRSMGRSMKKRTTLLTVPHSEEGYGSKRAVRGKIYFENQKIKSVRVTYRTRPLYPNAIDPEDVSVAKAETQFIVEGDRLTHYEYGVTPSSPQFILYSLISPEDAVIWHGVGAFGASQLIRSYTSTRLACLRDAMIGGLTEKYGVKVKLPLQFNLVPKGMWFHPIHRNIDASIGSVEDVEALARMGMKVEYLAAADYAR